MHLVVVVMVACCVWWGVVVFVFVLWAHGKKHGDDVEWAEGERHHIMVVRAGWCVGQDDSASPVPSSITPLNAPGSCVDGAGRP